MTVTVAKELGIVNLGPTSTDGTKIKANASNRYALSKEEIEEIRRIIERGIEVDEEEDQFLCPNGEVLTRKGEYEYNGKSLDTYFGANCGECPFRSECAGEHRRKVITGDDYEAERRRMAEKMRSEEGKEEYKKRKETVERPFGNIKHNLKVMWAKMAGKVAVLDKIGGLIANSASKAWSFFAFQPTLN